MICVIRPVLSRRAKVVIALIVFGVGLLWLNQTVVFVGRKSYEEIQETNRRQRLEIEQFQDRLEKEKQELRRYLLKPTKEEIKAYLVLQLDGHSNWAYRVAICESGLNPKALSPRGTFKGLFQFVDSTFDHYGRGNIFDWQAQTKAVKKMIETLGFTNAKRHWPVCGKL